MRSPCDLGFLLLYSAIEATYFQFRIPISAFLILLSLLHPYSASRNSSTTRLQKAMSAPQSLSTSFCTFKVPIYCITNMNELTISFSKSPSKPHKFSQPRRVKRSTRFTPQPFLCADRRHPIDPLRTYKTITIFRSPSRRASNV